MGQQRLGEASREERYSHAHSVPTHRKPNPLGGCFSQSRSHNNNSCQSENLNQAGEIEDWQKKTEVEVLMQDG